MQTSVFKSLTDGGRYLRKSLESEEALTFKIAGKNLTWILSPILREDIEIFAVELDNQLQAFPPIVKTLYASAADRLVDLIRVVDHDTMCGFKGSHSVGIELDAVLFRAEQFADPDSALGDRRINWSRQIAAPGIYPFISDGRQRLLIPRGQGMALLGFYNPAFRPCTSAFRVTTMDLMQQLQVLDFELMGSSALNFEPTDPGQPGPVSPIPIKPVKGGTLADLLKELEDAEAGIENADSVEEKPEQVESMAKRLIQAIMDNLPRSTERVIPLRQPLLCFPQGDLLVEVRYSRPGVDELRPIGLWIKPANSLRDLNYS